jgi:hypothetical protein
MSGLTIQPGDYNLLREIRQKRSCEDVSLDKLTALVESGMLEAITEEERQRRLNDIDLSLIARKQEFWKERLSIAKETYDDIMQRLDSRWHRLFSRQRTLLAEQYDLAKAEEEIARLHDVVETVTGEYKTAFDAFHALRMWAKGPDGRCYNVTAAGLEAMDAALNRASIVIDRRIFGFSWGEDVRIFFPSA